LFVSVSLEHFNIKIVLSKVLVFYGETIAQWKKEKYHEQPGNNNKRLTCLFCLRTRSQQNTGVEHENFRQLLAAPLADAKALLEDRFPAPRFVECDQHTSQVCLFMLIRLLKMQTVYASIDLVGAFSVGNNRSCRHSSKHGSRQWRGCVYRRRQFDSVYGALEEALCFAIIIIIINEQDFSHFIWQRRC
jgi:hypothetical protein